MSREMEYDLWALMGLCLAVVVWLIIEDGPQLWYSAVYAIQDVCNYTLFK